MKKILLIISSILLVNCVMAQELVILHTNDIHSHINGLSPETEYTPTIADNDLTVGGLSRIAGFIKSEKNKSSDNILVVDAGDFLMGTLFQTLETETGFQLNLMKKIGYDFVTFGNHEFDFGPNTLASIITNNQKLGAIPQLISSNYVFAEDGSDAELVEKFNNGTILPYSIVEKRGIKIGVMGVLGLDAVEAIAGYINVTFDKTVNVAKKTARFLKNEKKVDLVVVLSHSGVTKTKKGEWEGEDVKLGKAVPEIDVIISGHTHTMLPTIVKAGNAVVVQTGSMGCNVGKLVINFDKNRKPVYGYELVSMNDNINGDPYIQQLADEKAAYINQNLLAGLNIKQQQAIFETGFELVMNDKKPEPSNLGPFVSDAVYYFLNKKNNENIDVTVVATGVIRHDINVGKQGQQNINDIFNIMPLGVGEGEIPGSPLGRIYITGNELKKIMELILAVYHSKNDYYLYSTGMTIKCDPEKGLFKKISEISVGNDEIGYRKVSFAKKDKTLYSIAANKYILSFIGALKKMSFGLVNVIGKNANGSIIQNDNFLVDLDKQQEGVQEAKEWLAILDYVRSFPDINGNGVPDVPDVYKTKVNRVIIEK